MKSFLIFDNLNIAAVFDAEVVPQPDLSVWELLIEWMKKNGHDPEGARIETRHGTWEVYKSEAGEWRRREV